MTGSRRMLMERGGIISLMVAAFGHVNIRANNADQLCERGAAHPRRAGNGFARQDASISIGMDHRRRSRARHVINHSGEIRFIENFAHTLARPDKCTPSVRLRLQGLIRLRSSEMTIRGIRVMKAGSGGISRSDHLFGHERSLKRVSIVTARFSRMYLERIKRVVLGLAECRMNLTVTLTESVVQVQE